MKKNIILIFLFVCFLFPSTTILAAYQSTDGGGGVYDPIEGVFGKIVAPSPIQPLTTLGGARGLSFFLSRVIELIYVVASLLFVFMLVFSALQWITSGGEKEAVGKARSRLTYAIIGIILLALTFVILRVIGQITGFNFFAP